MVMDRSEAGNELAELLWENGQALRRTTAAPHFFPPFTCSAAGTSRAPELAKHPASTAAMRGLLAVQDDDDGGVPWLHYPVIDGDDNCDMAPLPPEYCSGLLAGYADLQAPAPAAVASRDAGAPSMSHGAVVVPRPEPAAPKQLPRPSGEGVKNFTFFSRPLQRPPPGGERAPAASNPVESTVVQTATNRLRSTPLLSEQRMAWLQPPPKESRTTVAAPPPPSPAPLVPVRQVETAAALTHRLQSEARAPEPPPPLPATATTSSVCSDNGDRSQLKRSSHHHAAEWSVSQDDEDLDDEAGALRRSAARSTKRGRTAEVHNMSERRRRDQINEKMHALQKLIPNCNKIDKASMLEEAIEYLKTLQLQVQMMSMGTGLCVPPMLLPAAAAAAAAMQHLQMPPMAHFHHHHHGAMGLAGFGMAAAFDPRVQFPCPMIPGAPPVFGVPGMGGHAMPSPAPFPPTPAPAAGAHMASVVVNNAAAQATAEQTMPSADHPQDPAGPRAM